MMRKHRDLIGLFLLALIVRFGTAALIDRPGYMDAAYYAAGAQQLAQGGGLTEPFIWNYLDDPAAIPHVGFVYWMPLASLLGAPWAALFPDSFYILQAPFTFLSAALPIVSYTLALWATQRRGAARVAGLLTLFSGFFFPYWTLPETFAPFALFGSAALLLAGYALADMKLGAQRRLAFLLVGLLAGLAHLTRADGVLVLGVVLPAALLYPFRKATRFQRGQARGLRLRDAIWPAVLIVLGYLLVMGPWFIRNVALIGAPLSPAGTQMLWLRTYDDIFCYGCELSFESYLAWGWPNILRSKLWALGMNLQRFLAEDCLVFLLPLLPVGIYRLRRKLPVVLGVAFLLLAFLAHTLAFTFPGPRGGFFHASAAALPIVMVAGVEGLEGFLGWLGRRRRWNREQARRVFGGAMVVMALVLSVYAAAGKLGAWQQTNDAYEEMGRWLVQQNEEFPTVAVANPPAFWVHTGIPAVVVPNGSPSELLAVADRYGVHYVLLDPNRPAGLAQLYNGTEVHPRLTLLLALDDRARVYRVVSAPAE